MLAAAIKTAAGLFGGTDLPYGMVARGNKVRRDTHGCATEGRAHHRRGEKQARQRPAQAVRQGSQHSRARRESRAVVRIRPSSAVRVGRDTARTRWCDSDEEEG